MPLSKVIFITKILTVINLAIQIHAAHTVLTKNISSTHVSTEHSLEPTAKKWQVGRVSRKHYEIVNMLWRKTKEFIDMETTTVDNRLKRNPADSSMTNHKNIKPLSSARPYHQSSTASFIEFYYLDDNDERIKRRDFLIPSSKLQHDPHHDDFKMAPFLSFHLGQVNTLRPINTAMNKETSQSSSQIRNRLRMRQNPNIYGFLSNNFETHLAHIFKTNAVLYGTKPIQAVTTEKYFDNEICPATFEPEVSPTTPDYVSSAVYEGTITSYEIESTTIYDKIKFFEMYDQQTIIPSTKGKKTKQVAPANMPDNEIDGNRENKLEDVDININNHDGNKVKNVKKHVDESLHSSTAFNTNNIKPKKNMKFKTVKFRRDKTDDNKNKKNEIVTTHKVLDKLQNYTYLQNSSRVATFTEYPFAAVFIYEPSQIHCDAAALSPHWLVAAGSCLSRFHRKDGLSNDLQGRTAYVAYCGQNWWQPERVSYVKYSVVHPRFHPRDRIRRFLFNVGLIQVVGSMSSCSGWAPVSLMSHNFAASDGSIATAVGWGLDRYDVRYTFANLPRKPLSAYSGYVYANTCPGSKVISELELYNGQSTTVKNNFYCLSLPPYSGEDHDPTHGSLLLVGGKLIALYLQEERRKWGEQSAQYTGVWRLVPWVHEVARELDEGDAIDI